MIKRLLLVVLLLVLVFGGIFGWKVHQIKQMAARSATPPPPATVAATVVKEETWQPFLTAVGSLTAVQGVTVSNEVPGQVQDISFESGQTVKKGDMLLQLDAEVDRAELQGLLAQKHLAQAQFERTSRLLKDKSISQSQYDEASAQLENIEAQIASKQALIAKKGIRAPFSGLLGIRKINVGEYLAPGSEIVGLQTLDPVYVDYAVPERYLKEVKVGQNVQVRVQAYPGQVFEGRITAVNPAVESTTRMVPVRGVLKNPDRALRPGMFAEVRLTLSEQRAVLTVPRTAVTYNPYGDAVFLITKGEQGGLVAQYRQVETGDVRGERVAIVKGLEAGDQVVSAGQVKLRNGQPVRIDNSAGLGGQEVARP